MTREGSVSAEFHSYGEGRILCSYDVDGVSEGQLVWLFAHLGLQLEPESREVLVDVLTGKIPLPDSVELTPS